METLCTAIFVGVLAMVCWVIAILQFMEKGFCMNNAYIFARKQEREHMNKKPYYRQTGIVFALIAAAFFCLAAEIILETGWLMKGVWVIIVLTVIYAIISSIKLETKNNNR